LIDIFCLLFYNSTRKVIKKFNKFDFLIRYIEWIWEVVKSEYKKFGHIQNNS